MIDQALLSELASGRGWVSASREVGSVGALRDTTTIDAMASEILRLRRELDEARGRARQAAQTLVSIVGAEGPKNVDELAERVRDAHDEAVARAERAEAALREIAAWREGCHESDRSMGLEPRAFGPNDVARLERLASRALRGDQ